jgi:hypothetical protein
MDQIWERLGNEFDTMGAHSSFGVRPELRNQVNEAWRHWDDNIEPGNRAAIVDRTRDLINSWADGAIISGERWQNTRSKLLAGIRQSKVPTTREALGDMIDALDTAMERAMPPADLHRWQQARGQWRNMLVLDKALGAGEEAAAGIITPYRLRMAASNVYGKKGFNRGRSPYTRLANAGVEILTEPRSSGTAERLNAMGIPQAARGGIGAYLGSILTGGHPAGAMAGGMVGAGAPGFLGSQMMRPSMQRWLMGPRPNAGLPLLLSAGRLNAGLQQDREAANKGRRKHATKPDDDLWLRALMLHQLQQGQGQ